MIRLFIVFAVIILLYLGFSALVQFDSQIAISVYDYSIETTIFSLTSLLIIITLLIFGTLKLIVWVFEIPFTIKKKLALKKAQKTTFSLVHAIANILIGNKTKAAEGVKRLETKVTLEHKELFELIKAETAEDFDQKIQYLRGLLLSSNYGYFAIKRLMELFYNNGLYEQAVDYAIKAFNINELDRDVLETLLNCYAKLALWPKFVFVVSKLARVDQKRLSEISGKVSAYYLLAAKNMLELGNDQEAKNHTELALEFNPANIEAIELYCALNLSLKHNQENVEILENAFLANPSFEIAEIYAKVCNLPAFTVYENLARLVDEKQYYNIFLAIAAYLDLPEKAQSLREPKLLSPPAD